MIGGPRQRDLAGLLRCLASDAEVAVEPITDTADGLLRAERDSLRAASHGRLCEFAAGRRAARRILRNLGFDDPTVLRKQGGPPEWPAGVVGSISHAGRVAAAIGTRRSSAAVSWGLDLEPFEPLEESIWATVLTGREQTVLGCLAEDARGTTALAYFSAKESTYKCQYPLTGAFLEFDDVDVDLDRDTGCFRASVSVPGRPPGEPLTFAGRLGVANGLVAAVVRAPSFNAHLTGER